MTMSNSILNILFINISLVMSHRGDVIFWEEF